MFLLGTVANPHLQRAALRVGLGGRRRPAEREGETASRQRQLWGGLVSRGRCTSALREPSLWRGITVPAYGLQTQLIVNGPTPAKESLCPRKQNSV